MLILMMINVALYSNLYGIRLYFEIESPNRNMYF